MIDLSLYYVTIYISGQLATVDVLILSQPKILAVKKEWPRTKKGLGKKEMKSKWAAKACVVLLLMEIKF